MKRLPFLAACFVGVVASECFAQPRPAETVKHLNGGYHGSVGVALIREDTIVVATESRTKTDGMLNPDTACKMSVVGNVVFAAAGLLKGNSNALGIVDYARSILEGDGRIEEKTDAFQSGASQLLTSWLDVLQEQDSIASSADFRYGHSLHAMFCFFSRGRPVVVKYDFVPWLDENQFKIRGAYDAGARKVGEIIFIGEYEGTQSLLFQDKQFAESLDRLDARKAAEALIRKQMELTPGMVGGPVDIAVVTNNGARWIVKKQNCN